MSCIEKLKTHSVITVANLLLGYENLFYFSKKKKEKRAYKRNAYESMSNMLSSLTSFI